MARTSPPSRPPSGIYDRMRSGSTGRGSKSTEEQPGQGLVATVRSPLGGATASSATMKARWPQASNSPDGCRACRA